MGRQGGREASRTSLGLEYESAKQQDSGKEERTWRRYPRRSSVCGSQGGSSSEDRRTEGGDKEPGRAGRGRALMTEAPNPPW